MLLYWVPDQVRPEYVLDDPEVVRMMREDQDAYQLRTKNVEHELVVPAIRQHPAIKVGVMGEPERATAALGRQISDEAVTSLVALIRAMEEWGIAAGITAGGATSRPRRRVYLHLHVVRYLTSIFLRPPPAADSGVNLEDAVLEGGRDLLLINFRGQGRRRAQVP